ncbi:MMPL family transporter [Streptomyces sp. NPDC007940]|uniref:MMPL family transporter n=1 Tax=Streptomyces sp. NPDC007940 TaxID=3364796 RepID=UPI0036EF1EC5
MTPRSGTTRTGRILRRLLPALLVVGWLALAATTGPYEGKLSDVATNDGQAYLPTSAESVEADKAQARFDRTAETYPAVVVYERTSGITAADRDKAAADAAFAARLPHLTGPVSPVRASEDGRALQFTVPVSNRTQWVHDTVTALRDRVHSGPGPVVHVTGLAGLFADLGAAFTSLDGTLLLVAVGLVVLVLILVYRSPTLPFVVLLAAVFAMGLAAAVVYALAKGGHLTLTGQSQGVLLVLVVGATTDYALLLISRYQEELRRTEDARQALTTAWRAVLRPVLASGGTVVLGTLCLLLSGLNSNRSLGPVAALGILASLLAGLTFVPAVLALTGRGTFWPLRPTYGSTGRGAQGVWARVAGLVERRQRTVLAASVLLLAVGAAFVGQFKASGLALSDGFTKTTDAVAGQRVLGEHFPGGTATPVTVIARAARADAVVTAVRGVPGVAAVTRQGPEDGLVSVSAVLDVTPDGPAGEQAVRRVRTAVHAVPGAHAQVGGYTAVALDTRTAGERDLKVVIPAVLAVILVILALLLRSLVAPVVLVASVVLSYAATMGVSALVFDHVLDFAGAEPWVPLLGFVFLVAFGVDYNIFLMHRVREEALRAGTRVGVTTALRTTGGVITSAGVVLAATFAALAVVPMVSMAQQAFIVAFGVLLDTFLVRSLLVPALTLRLDRLSWWPARLASRTEPAGSATARPDRTSPVGG